MLAEFRLLKENRFHIMHRPAGQQNRLHFKNRWPLASDAANNWARRQRDRLNPIMNSPPTFNPVANSFRDWRASGLKLRSRKQIKEGSAIYEIYIGAVVHARRNARAGAGNPGAGEATCKIEPILQIQGFIAVEISRADASQALIASGVGQSGTRGISG